MTGRDPYFLGYQHAEQERLQQQSEDLAPDSAALFDRIGIAPGSSAVEIGCGPQGCLELLSERVGATGRVVGVERSEEAVELARAFVTDRGVDNVTVLHAEGRDTGLPRSSFDLATARLVLVNVPDPDEIVAEMVAVTRPGGTVALHEAAWPMQIHEPPLAAWDELTQILTEYARLNGIDVQIGLKLPRMLRDHGLVGVTAHPFVHEYPPRHGRRHLSVDFVENLKGRVLDRGLATAGEYEALQGELRDHLDDTSTFVVSALYVQAWGRVPLEGEATTAR